MLVHSPASWFLNLNRSAVFQTVHLPKRLAELERPPAACRIDSGGWFVATELR